MAKVGNGEESMSESHSESDKYYQIFILVASLPKQPPI